MQAVGEKIESLNILLSEKDSEIRIEGIKLLESRA